jgi:hypothetical protein
MPAALYPYAARRSCRRATPATLTGVNGRPTRAWALSTDSETPRCSDQLKESNAAHAKVEVTIATFLRLICFMDFTPLFPARLDDAPSVPERALRQIKGFPEDRLLA